MKPLPENPIRRLQLVAQHVRQHDPELADWFASLLEGHISRGESLDRLLGLTGGTGGRTPRFEILRERRDAILLRAQLAAGGSLTALADEIERYLTRTPLAERSRAQPAASWSEARRLVHEAARLGVALPATTRGLRKTVRAEGTELPLLRSDGIAHDSLITQQEIAE
jgi:hypothetical protein